MQGHGAILGAAGSDALAPPPAASRGWLPLRRSARVARNALYVQGIVEGTPEYQLRVVRINLSNTGGNFIKETGTLPFFTAAVVPDHLPRLLAGDVVEIRQTGTWRTLERFTSTKEGNVVVRVMCRKQNPDYDHCLKRGPATGKIQGVGLTKTPYPRSVADYGYQFSAFYSPTGEPLRSLP